MKLGLPPTLRGQSVILIKTTIAALRKRTDSSHKQVKDKAADLLKKIM